MHSSFWKSESRCVDIETKLEAIASEGREESFVPVETDEFESADATTAS